MWGSGLTIKSLKSLNHRHISSNQTWPYWRVISDRRRSFITSSHYCWSRGADQRWDKPWRRGVPAKVKVGCQVSLNAVSRADPWRQFLAQTLHKRWGLKGQKGTYNQDIPDLCHWWAQHKFIPQVYWWYSWHSSHHQNWAGHLTWGIFGECS